MAKRALLAILPRRFYFLHRGHCPCCQQQTDFLAGDPWLRDRFRCMRCGSIPRQRALMLVLEVAAPRWRDSSIHESSPSGGGASDRIREECARYLPSQYFADGAPGEVRDGQRNENLEAMTFGDETFDITVTQDVLEHVFDPRAVFREIARTLKPGGCHVFTVPLVNKHRPSQVRALKTAEGGIQFIGEAEFHGNPINPTGSPVTMHWGFDIVAFIREASGLETDIIHLDDLDAGVRAEFIEVLVTRKPPPA